MNVRHIAVRFIFIPLIIGFIALGHVMRDPYFAAIREVDILQILAAGMCFGVALAGILVISRRHWGDR